LGGGAKRMVDRLGLCLNTVATVPTRS